jgi:hypothetical protein
MYGSFNDLEITKVSDSKFNDALNPESPQAIRKYFELDKLDKELFPLLVTGVSAWPFLTLAMKYNNDTQKDSNEIFRITKEFRKNLNRNGGKLKVGPTSINSLRPYRTIAKNIIEAKDKPQVRELYNFLRKQNFNGDPKFFVRYNKEKLWQEAFLKANGKPAIGFVNAYTEIKRKKAKEEEVYFGEIITLILKKNRDHYNEIIWKGAFGYAMLRCLFGHFDKNAEEEVKVQANYYALEWKKLLLKILDEKSEPKYNGVSRYKQLLNQINDEKSIAPLANITKRYRANDKPVLTSFRMHLFYKLYFKPTSDTIKRFNNI